MSISLQTSLTKMQAFPVVGPLIFSPVKATVSIIEIVTKIALAVLLTLGALITLIPDPQFSLNLFTFTGYALKDFFEAWGSLALAILNLGTLGIAGAIYNSVHDNVNTTETSTN